MKAVDLRKKYLDFFVSKKHKVIKSASLIPDNDPTCLFTTAGMHPLVPFLQGEKHPLGTRLVNVQKCIRTGDIEEVGDPVHLTFFEMLGNWSLGDYFKEDAIRFSFEFLTSPEWLNIPISKLAVTVFAGDDDAPFDDLAYNLWQAQPETPQEQTCLSAAGLKIPTTSYRNVPALFKHSCNQNICHPEPRNDTNKSNLFFHSHFPT